MNLTSLSLSLLGTALYSTIYMRLGGVISIRFLILFNWLEAVECFLIWLIKLDLLIKTVMTQERNVLRASLKVPKIFTSNSWALSKQNGHKKIILIQRGPVFYSQNL